jgi:uncharacterized protein YnzC (UPF0291/DUF896 family)
MRTKKSVSQYTAKISARCTHEIKSRIARTKEAFNRKNIFTRKLGLNLREIRCHVWIVALCGAETKTLRKVDRKYLESFKIWFWRRMEKISWMDRVRNEELTHRVKQERNILSTAKRRQTNWLGLVLRRNRLL